MDKICASEFTFPVIRNWRVCSGSKTISGLISFIKDPYQLDFEVTEPCVIEGSIWGDDIIQNGMTFPIQASRFSKVGALSLNQFRSEGKDVPDMFQVTTCQDHKYCFFLTNRERVNLVL